MEGLSKWLYREHRDVYELWLNMYCQRFQFLSDFLQEVFTSVWDEWIVYCQAMAEQPN